MNCSFYTLKVFVCIESRSSDILRVAVVHVILILTNHSQRQCLLLQEIQAIQSH
jgi:hypothetical protein